MTTFRILWQRLKPYLFFFLICEALLRFVLIGRELTNIDGNFIDLVKAMVAGSIFDTATFVYFLIPLTLLTLPLASRFQGRAFERVFYTVFFFIFSYIVLFTSVGEWFFWDEFQSRYNFIAVDYLVYTQEVIGNIRESYPVGMIMSVIAFASLFLSLVFYRFYHFAQPMNFRKRLLAFSAICGLAIASFFAVNGNYALISQNRYITEIARNGFFELFSAYRHNELSYEKFYVSKPLPDVVQGLQKELGSTQAPSNSPLHHAVTAHLPEHQYNLVLITVESLSADFFKAFGNKDNLTPHLDALADQSLFFTNLYATGTRTVYGLSALTLSIPPVPGNAIARRPGNDNLFSLGGVLQSKGYATKFIYGGFGYFDNMNAFFANNGYEIVDRNNLSKDEIHFANVWGVADDDLYRRVVKENDKAYSEKRPFFDMIMTTSNHRPFTYPDGKIDIPSHTGRAGGVKYTDYTINEFLAEAKKHPWFDHTIFVIVADHTAGSSGKSDLDPTKYHIPMLIYAPKIVKPAKVDWMASQIDVAPTLLGLIGISYDSQFYGKDLMVDKPGRAFVSNYQQLGYMNQDGLVVLKPVKQTDFYTRDQNNFIRNCTASQIMLDKAVTYYQGATQWGNWSKKP